MPALEEWLADEVWKPEFGAPFAIPLLRAIVAHLYIAWIHPFGDGNGRTARLVEADLLARFGVPEISCHTPKTLTRDIRELLGQGLIRRVGPGFVANLEEIEAFVPLARPL